jgi:hypothetical protein
MRKIVGLTIAIAGAVAIMADNTYTDTIWLEGLGGVLMLLVAPIAALGWKEFRDRMTA